MRKLLNPVVFIHFLFSDSMDFAFHVKENFLRQCNRLLSVEDNHI